MSVSSQTNVHCKLCGNSQPFTTWTTVNVTLNPDLRDKLLKGDLTRFTCERCGWSGDVLYPLLYHDMGKHFMVWLWPDSGEPDTSGAPTEKLAPDYRFRLVPTRNDLVEKILIFEHNMDDRVLEAVKLRLWAQAMEQGKPYEGRLFFSKILKEPKGVEQIELRHITESGVELLTVPFDFYHRTRESVTGKLPTVEVEHGSWLRVDKEYAKRLAAS